MKKKKKILTDYNDLKGHPTQQNLIAYCLIPAEGFIGYHTSSTDNEFMEDTQNICKINATKLLSMHGCNWSNFSGLITHSRTYTASDGLCVPITTHWLPCEYCLYLILNWYFI